MPTLDAIDRKILALLQSDSRMTMQELADKVGLSVSPCHRRVKLLEERGVITRYIATVDQKSLGLHVSVFNSIKLTRLDDIASIESSFALSQVKYSIALPV